MFDEEVNGHHAGEVETPAVTEGENGISFRLMGTSPVMVGYKKAAEMLTMAEFASNPMDALYTVYQTLLTIRETAASFFEERNPEHEKLGQALPFDDIFSLFLMVFLGSEVLDLDGLFHFIDDFIRKPVPSSLEYHPYHEKRQFRIRSDKHQQTGPSL